MGEGQSKYGDPYQLTTNLGYENYLIFLFLRTNESTKLPLRDF
jgi:hypothetical protein